MRGVVLGAIGISAVIEARLVAVAFATDNWPGFWYSTLHTLGVAAVVVALLKWLSVPRTR